MRGLTIAKPKDREKWKELCSDSRGGDKGPYHSTQHRKLERVPENVLGKVKAVTKVVDTIAELYRNQTIDHDMYVEAQDFKAAFDVAGMSGLRASSPEGVPGGCVSGADDALRITHARNELWRVYTVLGGAECVMSRAMHNIVGLETSLRGMEKGCPAGRRHFWLGALVAALETLSRHRAGIFEKRC